MCKRFLPDVLLLVDDHGTLILPATFVEWD